MSTRVSCGTVFGTQLHYTNAEPLCPTCLLAERARAATAEYQPVPEQPAPGVTGLIREAVHALAVALGTPAKSL